ncbi:MAG TPA: BCAM0308 family protein [Noviherbaspirillum sp.]|uniref:BCAM0308 family protein n=1 Tax=Noviherbaspirillum sp. TaxID=1926288 RepID=UPI002B46BA77|nr:BCAM0308 family protein [Noviherbaspirillum sp.]HJV86386.1 BCAM0308 family protein [Noviherbaspirillum sp.]
MNTAPSTRSASQSGQRFEMPGDDDSLAGMLSGTAVCEACGAVHREGHWQWAIAPAGAQAVLCPACRRMEGKQAAGHITIDGGFACEHRDEIIHLIRHIEMHEKAEHPMQRIISCCIDDGRLLIDTTEAQLACAIGEALERTYQGELWLRHVKPGELVRLHWQR